MDNAVSKIREELHQLMIDGIKYEKIGDKILKGFQVVAAVFNPDGPDGARLMVLMVRP